MDKIDVEETIKQLQQQIAAQTAQEIVEDMTSQCFKSCIKKPGTSLDKSEQRCISYCMERYIDSHNLISKVFTSRMSERGFN